MSIKYNIMNFKDVTKLVIPQGEVIQIQDNLSRILWKKDTIDYTEPFYVENITNSEETLSIKRSGDSAPTVNIEISSDRINWEAFGSTSTTTALSTVIHPGEKLYMRSSAYNWGGGYGSYGNVITGVSKVGGNIMSLLYGADFTGEEKTLRSSESFCRLFAYNSNLIDASNLLLPAERALDRCYHSMFYSCGSLTTAPELPATRVGLQSYNSMFNRCGSLTTAPELPATRVDIGSYYQMFYGCGSLTTAPELPAATLYSQSYYWMFFACKNINYIKCLATNISASNCLSRWVYEVATSGTFVKKAGVEWPSGESGIPSGWTVVEV